jgi:putative toxin-antitoxin system antitoxin component (TIGR02293 family)
METSMSHTHALDIVGGAALGIPIRNARELIAAVRGGLPVKAVEHVIDTGRMTLSEIDRVVLPRKTLSHRRKIGRLTAEQSDRLMRAARVIAAAEETFGSQQKAATWLRRPTTALDGETPLSLLDTSEGALQVETLLGRIGHGIAA